VNPAALLNRTRAAWRALTGNSPQRSMGQWDAAATGPRAADWWATPSGFGSHDSPLLVRSRSEDAYRNNPWARAIVDKTVAAAVGASGITPQFRAQYIGRLWSTWSDQSDSSRRHDWAGLLSQLLQTVMVSGEAFVLLTIDERSSPVPLSLKLLGPQYLDTSRTNERNTYGGIEYDSQGHRTAYWLYEAFPDPTFPPKSVRVDATDVLHIYKPISPEAERGVSWLSPVLLALRELKAYLEAQVVKARAAACFMGVVRSPRSNPLAGPGKLFELEPLTTVRLDADEEITWSDPPDIETAFDPFVQTTLRKIAVGVGMPFEILSSDHRSVTFASGRHGLLDWKRTIESIQYNLLVYQFCRPVLERWLTMAQALQLVPDADFSDVRWIAPTLQMLDPQREVLALRDSVRCGFISRSEVVRMSGWNSEQIDREISSDNARADELGLTFDSDPRKVSQQGQQQAQNTPQGKED